MSLGDKLQTHLRGNKRGMVHDAMFALIWVGVISLLFDFVFVTAPMWAYYLFLFCGVPSYFGFFWSLEIAKAQQE
jgi:hypothetical protein